RYRHFVLNRETAVSLCKGVLMYKTNKSLFRASSPKFGIIHSYRFALISISLSLCFAQTGVPELPDPGIPSVTREQQQQLGAKTAAEVYKQMPVLPDDSPETKYVRELGNRLVATIPPEHSWPFEFHVVSQKEINAFALPGGEMFVNIGTITAAANEAEL